MNLRDGDTYSIAPTTPRAMAGISRWLTGRPDTENHPTHPVHQRLFLGNGL